MDGHRQEGDQPEEPPADRCERQRDRDQQGSKQKVGNAASVERAEGAEPQEPCRADARRYFANARALLLASDPEALPPESEGLTAGRLLAILTSMEEALA